MSFLLCWPNLYENTSMPYMITNYQNINVALYIVFEDIASFVIQLAIPIYLYRNTIRPCMDFTFHKLLYIR